MRRLARHSRTAHASQDRGQRGECDHSYFLVVWAKKLLTAMDISAIGTWRHYHSAPDLQAAETQGIPLRRIAPSERSTGFSSRTTANGSSSISGKVVLRRFLAAWF